jgi:hypothetical protein
MCRTHLLWGEADAFREETGRSTGKDMAGYGSERLCKDCRDNVGKDHLPAGTGDNLQRLVYRGATKEDERDLVWRMSPFERRRRGNALREDPGDPPQWGNTPLRPRGSRYLAGSHLTPDRAQDRIPVPGMERVEPRSKPHQSGAYARQRLSFGCCGKAPWGHARAANRTREIRPSGMKAGASGNVTMGAGLRSAAKPAGIPPDPTVRALEIYPNIFFLPPVTQGQPALTERDLRQVLKTFVWSEQRERWAAIRPVQ